MQSGLLIQNGCSVRGMGGDRRGNHPSEISDDDSISLTSTVASVQKEEYLIEGIIAERDNNGIMEYLARWEGYPDERCTWEVREHFTDITLLEWETQKMRVARGYAQPYNVEALLDRVEEWISATKQRKSRRRAKRLRLGLPVSPLEETNTDENESYEEVEEASSDEEYDLESPVSRNSTKSKSASLSGSRRQSDHKENQSSSSRLIAPVANMARNLGEVETQGYLADMPGAQSTESIQKQGSGKAPTAVMSRPQTRDGESGGSRSLSASSGASPTEISFGWAGNAKQQDQAPGLSKKRSSAAKPSPTRSKVGIDGRGFLSENHSPETDQASKVSSASSPKHALPTSRRKSLADPDSLRKMPKEPFLPNPVSPAAQNSRRRSLPEPSSKPTKTLLKISRRSTKIIPENSSGTRKTQIGNGGRGPARLSLSKCEPSTNPSKKFGGVSGAAILSNWNKEPKRRKSNAFQPGSSDKPAQKFSTVRKYYKRGRNEPAPNIEMLTFVNLKGGGVVKKPPRATPKVEPPKNPYQLIQEGLKLNIDTLPQVGSTEKSSSSELNLDDENRQTDPVGLKKGQSAKSEILGSNPALNDPIPVSLFEVPTVPNQKFKKRSSFVSQDHLRQKSRQSSPNQKSNDEAGIFKALQAQASPAAQDLLSPHDTSPIQDTSPMQDVSPMQVASPEQDASSIQDVSLIEDAMPIQDTSPVEDALPIQDASPVQDVSSTKDVSVTPKGPRKKKSTSNARRSLDNLAPSKDKSAFTLQPADWTKSASYSHSHAPTQTVSTIPYGPTTMAQRNRATPAQMREMHSGVTNDILGNILIEQDGKDLGDVRFRGMDWQARQLFLTIKVPPRQVHVTCKNICTIGEFQEFYRGVGDI